MKNKRMRKRKKTKNEWRRKEEEEEEEKRAGAIASEWGYPYHDRCGSQMSVFIL